MAYKNYLIYFDSEDIDSSTEKKELEKLFTEGNVYHLNASSSFVIKVSEDKPLSEIQEEVGFSNTTKIRGIIIEMLSGYRNGWYSRSFWDFLNAQLKVKEE